MKKAIIIFTILSLITIGFSIYEGYLYINSLNSLNELTKEKSEIIDNNALLEKENIELEKEYNQKTQDLLENNTGCKLWKNQEEVLKKIKE